MKGVWSCGVLGFVVVAPMSMCGPAHAQTVLLSSIANNDTFTYGDQTFTITGCTGCGTGANAEIIALHTGRSAGTEIEIAAISGSNIFKSSSGSYSLSFNLAVTPTTGSAGISTVQNILTGADSGNNQTASDVKSVVSKISGDTPSFSTATSEIGALTSTTGTFSGTGTSGGLVPIGTAANFNIDLTVTHKSGDTLTLTNVALLFTPAPEPASLALLTTGVGGLVAMRRRAKQRVAAQ